MKNARMSALHLGPTRRKVKAARQFPPGAALQ